jgi:cytochrome c-type biogenesis protein
MSSPPPVYLALLAGLLAALSPCILPILPLIVGRSLQAHRLGPLVMVLGLVAGFAVTGSLLGVTASWLGGLMTGLRWIAVIVLLLAGVLVLFPKLNYRIWSYIPLGRWFKEPMGGGLVAEFWLGSQLGLLWTPCAGPVLVSILVLAATQQKIFATFGLLCAFGCGTAIPLLLLAYGGRALGQKLLKLRSWSQSLQRLPGIMIVGTALAILLGWDVQVQLWLAPLFPATRL